MDEHAYSGRWVARLRGRIVGQGGTPEQARRAAFSRFKEKPEIVFMPYSDLMSFPPLLEKILEALPSDQTIYLVGGAMRDLLLGRTFHDFDFTVERGGISAARKVAEALHANFYPLDTERDTGRVLFTEENGTRVVLDFAAFRGPDLEADLRGRDFTLNAIALDLRTRQAFDPLGGGSDLRAKLLRACSPTAFLDDPIRILRGVRLAAEFGFRILPDTRQSMKAAAPRLANISSERVRDELFRILEGPIPASCFRALEILGTLPMILPELVGLKGETQPAPHVHDVWSHTLAVLSSLEMILGVITPEHNPEKAADLFSGLMVSRIGRYREQISEHLNRMSTGMRSSMGLLFFAALYHDAAKPQARKVDEEGQLRFWDHDQQGAEIAGERGRQLAISNDQIDRLETIIRNHMRIPFHIHHLLKEGKSPSRRAIYRFFRDSGPAGVELCLLALADLRATYEETLPQDTWEAALDVVRLLLENWFEKPTDCISPPALVDGTDIMNELGIKPGAIIGEILDAIREAQAMGEVATREQALALGRSKLG